jgi:hypothetical protein
MAAPHVAGLAALILGVDPTLTPVEVQQIIRDGALDMGDPGFDWVYGYGRIDVINSLSLLTPTPCGDGTCDPGEDACSCPADCTGTEADCADGIDDDCDGVTDCADVDCTGDPACDEVCDDGIDNDFDGSTDCADADCTGDPVCDEVCDDGIDNDVDSLTDCDDPDCAGCDGPPTAVCQSIARDIATGETVTVTAEEIAGFSSANGMCCTLTSILIRRPGGAYGGSVTFTVDDIATNPNPVEALIVQSDSQTATCTGHVTLNSVGAKPVLTTAISRKDHGSAGVWGIDVGAGDIESRSAQLGTANPNEVLILATFHIDVDLLGGADVTADIGTVSVAPGAAANELAVTITDLPFNGQVNLGFGGVVDAMHVDPAYASDSTLCVRVIVGDYDNLAMTNFFDFSKVQNAGYLDQVVDSVDKARADFDCSERPSFLDFSEIRNAGLLNVTAPACPSPPIGP